MKKIALFILMLGALAVVNANLNAVPTQANDGATANASLPNVIKGQSQSKENLDNF
jgi:hypothetical protein